MDLHYKQEVTVGTVVLIGFGLFVFGAMWLKGTTLHRTQRTVTVQFADIGGLKEDNDVTVSGYSVGKVQHIEFEAPGRVKVTASVPPSLDLRADASASIQSGFFSSDSKLLLNTGSPDAPPLQADAVIQGSINGGLFAKGASLADRADSTLIGVQAIANQRTADDLHRTLQAFERLANTLNRRLPNTGSEADSTLRAIRRLSQRLDSTIATIPVASAVARTDTLATRMGAMSEQLTRTGARLDSLLSGVNQGKGTLGKFATDSSLYNDMHQMLQSLKILLDELNKNPGKITVQVKLF
jgi:phospholipid/cholesterol/gamma-HCH transport system substrate-binding protein